MVATTFRSPPPDSRPSKPQKDTIQVQLRSGSGLSFHTNRAAFRHYTDYNKDGTLRLAGKRARSSGFDPLSADTLPTRDRSLEPKRHRPETKPLPDFFDPDVMKMAFSDPVTGRRLYHFAKSRHRAADVLFLVKVDEYTRAMGDMTSVMNQISTNFTDPTAASPLNLPQHVSKALTLNTRSCTKSVLPHLERLYRDATESVQERLARDLFPDFVRFQLCQCIQSSLVENHGRTKGAHPAYPGLMESFCLTDPRKAGNPVVFASDGFFTLSGYSRQEMMNKSCSVIQGAHTDTETRRRIGKALADGRETAELIVNYRNDGTPFWNLLFICPLVERGRVRYHLGAQINVSESMGAGYEDILRILNFSVPGEGFSSHASPKAQGRRPVFKTRAPQKQVISVRENTQSPGNLLPLPARLLGRLSPKPARPGDKPHTPQPAASVTSENARSTQKRPLCGVHPPPPTTAQHLDESSTPYSRLLVMRYYHQPAATTTTTTDEPHHHSPSPPPPPGTMPIMFCSPSASETLGLFVADSSSNSHDDQHDQIIGRDIFAVLAERLNSSTATRGVRSTVLKKVGAGKAVCTDLARDVLFGGCRTRRLVGHWVPLLRDGDDVGFVVLILTPMECS
ncbi:putative Phototropin [Echria macrotheca]|uniref:Phototropin n=1 Tax=Echria macrotheca TaxID=438768 RepID=A0AAJ0BH97_9PEZI|nr:putative Phototropin [Echria macrotheca]